jgi:hypothetical protein
MKNFGHTPVSATETLKGMSLLAFTLAFLSYMFGITEDMRTLNDTFCLRGVTSEHVWEYQMQQVLAVHS